MVRAEKQRLKRASIRTAKTIRRRLKALEKEPSDIDQDIDESIRRSPNWLERAELLKFAPGIGDQIARTLMAELPELGKFDRRRSPFSLAGHLGRATRKMAGQEDTPPSAPPSTWEPSSPPDISLISRHPAIASLTTKAKACCDHCRR